MTERILGDGDRLRLFLLGPVWGALLHQGGMAPLQANTGRVVVCKVGLKRAPVGSLGLWRSRGRVCCDGSLVVACMLPHRRC